MDILYQVVTKRLSECFKQPGSFIFKNIYKRGSGCDRFWKQRAWYDEYEYELIETEENGFFNLNIAGV